MSNSGFECGRKKRGGKIPPPHFQGKQLGHLFCESVEVEVQREDVDARFAEQAELATGDVLLDELTYLIFAEAACLGDARRLVERGVGRDIGVKSGTRGGNQVDWDGLARICRGQFIDVALNALHKLGVGLGEV